MPMAQPGAPAPPRPPPQAAVNPELNMTEDEMLAEAIARSLREL